MGFADDVKRWANDTKVKIDQAVERNIQNAGALLEQILGEDAKKITKGAYDVASGRFYDVVAPDEVLRKMREANLLRDSDASGSAG